MKIIIKKNTWHCTKARLHNAPATCRNVTGNQTKAVITASLVSNANSNHFFVVVSLFCVELHFRTPCANSNRFRVGYVVWRMAVEKIAYPETTHITPEWIIIHVRAYVSACFCSIPRLKKCNGLFCMCAFRVRWFRVNDSWRVASQTICWVLVFDWTNFVQRETTYYYDTCIFNRTLKYSGSDWFFF